MPDYWCGPCEVFVVIRDVTCVGYEVYVDDVYQFTEGQDELLDGYCEFYVTAGTHTIEIRKNGCSASMTGDFQPLTVVPIQWTSMPECWCNCNKRDLIIQDITWSPCSSELGDTVTFTVIVENIGEFTADPSTVKYYINNQYIDFDNIPSLSPCATSTQTFTWTASSCGNVLVKAVADANNDVQERDETNNEKQKSSEIYGPDLIVQEISWPSEPVCLDKPVTITVTVKNQGNRAAGASTVKYYIDNLPIDSDSILSLNSVSTSTQTFSWTPTICGYHNIKAVADANNNVQECDETNNEKQKSVHVRSPDLIIQSLTWAPKAPKKGDSITSTVTIKNQGDADADSSHVRLFIRNIEVDPASASVGPIAAGSTVSKTFTWTADSCAKTAVSVIADADNEVDESREDNNYLPETIYVKCPDLEITDISWSPKGDDLHAGDDMTISYKIRNNGEVDTKDFKTRIMIDSLPFRTFFTPSLSANTETIGVFTWKAVRGTHSIKVDADAQKRVEESDETNNEARGYIVVDEEPVDLIITGIEVTQAIQNLDGDVPLIEGKDTFVRVYMKTNSRSISNVKGTLKGFRNSKSIGEITNLNKWNYIAKNSGKKRPSIDERRSDDFYLLIFKLPDEWLSGDITIKVEIEPDPRYTLEEICSCTPCERKLQFNKAGRFTIAFVPIHHKPSNTKPDFGDIEKVYQEFVKLYPVSKDDVSIELWPALEIDYNPTNNESKECPTAWGNCGLRLLGEIKFLESYQTRKKADQNLIVFGLVDSEVKYKAANRGPLWGYGEMGDGKTFGTRCAWGIDGTFGGSYMAHGIGHNLGRKHIDCGGPKNIDKEWPYQGDECHLAPETPAGFWGFDVNERSVRAPSEYSDFMTFSAPYWVSNYTYTALFDLIKSSSKSSLMVMSQPTGIDMILISGLINIFADNAIFDDFFHINKPPQPPSSTGQHRIELQSSTGDVLVNHSFDIPDDASGSDIRTFSVDVPYNSSTARIVLKHNSTVLANRTVSNNTPNVTVKSPNGGEILSGTANISWTAYDSDSDELNYTVEYSPDNGSTWLPPIAIDLVDERYLCDTSDLQGSKEGLIRVTATDGVNTGRDISDAVFTVPEKGPEAGISNPTNGTLITEGSYISLIGEGYDLEDGMLNDSALTWTSNQNGVLGNGKELRTRNLTRGVHTITLMGEDGNGVCACDKITLSVLDSATIYTPKGTVRLSATDGVIIGDCLVNESLLPPLPDVEFPFGVFNFNISNISSGQTVNVSIELPQYLPSDAKYWMYGRTTDNPSPHWYDDIQMEICEDNRTVTIQLTDGGIGDDDMNKNGKIVVTGAPGVPVIPIFDTKAPANPYPSVSGTHTGTITPIRDVNISKLYTYPCSGTGGHTESIELYENNTLIANGTWTGYKGDWHNITIHNLTGGVPYVTLLKTHKYNYTILTGSYPQIHHNSTLLTDNGWINCTDFTDSNGKRYYDWIPAIRLW
nr:hypothetical protein PKPCIMEP_00010 [Methanosarcinales archaeon ANME-1 ERB6]